MKSNSYRVRSVPNGEWSVWKKGETTARGTYGTQDEAQRVAATFADQDERQRVDDVEEPAFGGAPRG